MTVPNGTSYQEWYRSSQVQPPRRRTHSLSSMTSYKTDPNDDVSKLDISEASPVTATFEPYDYCSSRRPKRSPSTYSLCRVAAHETYMPDPQEYRPKAFTLPMAHKPTDDLSSCRCSRRSKGKTVWAKVAERWSSSRIAQQLKRAKDHGYAPWNDKGVAPMSEVARQGGGATTAFALIPPM